MLNLTLSVILLMLTYIFYKNVVNDTSVDLLIFIKKRSIILVLIYIFYKKEVNNTSVDLLIFIKKRSIILVLTYNFHNNYPIINVKFTLSSISSDLLD